MNPVDANADARDRKTALYMAMVVRNALEDFHARHLSDDLMRELNPIIRDGIYTALHAARLAPSIPGADAFVHFQKTMIPKYWEDPELLDDYVETVHLYETRGGRGA